MATTEDHTEDVENDKSKELDELVEILYHLDPKDLKKFRSFNHKFEKIVEDVAARKSCDCLCNLKRLSGLPIPKDENLLQKIFHSATALLFPGKKIATSQLKLCAPHVTQINLSVDPETIENPDPILFQLPHHCGNIETLNLNSCNVSTKGILALKGMKKLKNLSLCFYDDMTEEILSAVFQLSQLKNLKICWNHSLPLAAFENIGQLENLETLNVSHSNVTDDELQHIGALPQLISLNCEGCIGVSDLGIRALKKCQSLKHLNLSGCTISDEGLPYIAEFFPSLTTLDLRKSRVSDRTTPLLCKLEHLRSLDLSMGQNLTADCIRELSSLPGLQILSLSHCEQINFSKVNWKSFDSLMILDLSYCQLNDDVLAEVALIPMLTNASFSYSDAITIEGVRSLTFVPHLRFLDLIYCGLDEDEVRALFSTPVELRV